MSAPVAVNLPAGRELDALVAERVFGLVRCQGECHQRDDSFSNETCYALPESPKYGGELRCYSSDIAAAWEVVTKMVDGYHEFFFQADAEWCHHGAGDYAAKFGWPPPDAVNPLIHAETAPLAICLAALKAVDA